MAVDPPSWVELRDRLRRLVEEGKKSRRQIARELDLSHPGLRKILEGETKEPQPATRARILRWVEQEEASREREERELVDTLYTEAQEFAVYLLRHFDQLATFMATTTEGLSEEDRRKLVFAILTGIKRLALELGEPIPPELFDIERRFLAD